MIREGALDYISARQKETLFSVPKAELVLHCGPYGCGKTYALNLALGLACMVTPPPKSDSCIALIGKTAQSVKMNICNGLANMFGDNFRYDTGKKDGYTKDAVLFGHRIRIIGLNDSNAEQRIRGLNTYKVYGDEVSTWGEENYNLVHGRIRGEVPDGWEAGFLGSTNPDSPVHWLKKVIDTDSNLKYVEWSEYDNVTPSAEKYYAGLRERYKNYPAYIQRYIYGKWSASEGLVYSEFNENIHILNDNELEGIEFKYFTIGADFGTTNMTALLLSGVTVDDEVVILDEEYLEEASVRTGRIALQQLILRNNELTRGNIENIYIDPAAKVFKRELQETGFNNITSAKNDVEQGITKVKELFSLERLYITKKCTNLQAEFYAYKWNPKSSDGRNLVIKEHDHACDALRYLIYTDEEIQTYEQGVTTYG